MLLVLFQGCGVEKPAESRPAEWATAIKRPGLPNLHKVGDHLYRGAQPKKEGVAELKKLGIKTIVNFRDSQKDLELLEGTDFKYVSIPVNTFRPKIEQFQQFINLFKDPAGLPVFVHCKHGADRTGAAVALYRVMIRDWTVDAAVEEMLRGGYNFHTMHRHLEKFVRRFVREARSGRTEPAE